MCLKIDPFVSKISIPLHHGPSHCIYQSFDWRCSSMHVKEIIRPEVRETFFYGKIISWKFNDSIVHIKARNKYCYRVTLIFESGDQADYQKGGFNTKAEAVKAKETAIA